MGEERPPGLCATCEHVRRQNSDRASVFWRCALAETDRRYPKYPPLPVLACPGHRPASVPGPP